MTPTHDKPLAAYGLESYRYKGRYDWVMIGAINDSDALHEASRSVSDEINPLNLQKWNGDSYTSEWGQSWPAKPENA